MSAGGCGCVCWWSFNQVRWELAVVAVASAVVVMIAVVFMVPVAFVHLPPLLVVVVVGVAPVGAGVGGTIPASADPVVATLVVSPVAVDPLVAFTGSDGADFVAERGWSSTDVDADLPKCGDSECRHKGRGG